MRSPSTSCSSSSSSCDSHYYSAIPSPSFKEFYHDGFTVSKENFRMNSTSPAPSSSFPSSQYLSFTPSPSTKENTYGVSINGFRSEDDDRFRPSCSTSITSSSTNSSSQTSSTNPSPTSHDVFISFRGKDTRNGIVSHLLAAFTRHGIKAYLDSHLERGSEISPTLFVAIKQSKILLLVFSENYAESRWTMDELAKIMECKRTRGQYVIPIFYKVRPTDVRHQKGTYEIAFKQHKKLFKAKNEIVKQWMKDMTDAADLSGWEVPGSRSEAELVEEIAINVSRKLEIMNQLGSMGESQIATEPQEVNFAPQNHSNENISGDSHDHSIPEESFPNKCLSNRGGLSCDKYGDD